MSFHFREWLRRLLGIVRRRESETDEELRFHLAMAEEDALRRGQSAWHVVKKFAEKTGVSKLAPHDLRRSCARLCRAAGGELEQIQFLLGHISVQTTERYLAARNELLLP